MELRGLPVARTSIGYEVVWKVLQQRVLLDIEENVLPGFLALVDFRSALSQDRRGTTGGERSFYLKTIATKNSTGGVGDLDFSDARIVRVAGPYRTERRRGALK